jgi:hypothetical protein
MPRVTWSASSRGEYWIDVDLGGQPLKVLIDTGLLDAREQVGFSIEQALYDRIKQAGQFHAHLMHARQSADGQIAMTESGSLGAQLISPQTRQLVGPVVHVYVFRGVPGIPDRVGMAFFHHLKGCKVLWDLDKREWCIESP